MAELYIEEPEEEMILHDVSLLFGQDDGEQSFGVDGDHSLASSSLHDVSASSSFNSFESSNSHSSSPLVGANSSDPGFGDQSPLYPFAKPARDRVTHCAFVRVETYPFPFYFPKGSGGTEDDIIKDRLRVLNRFIDPPCTVAAYKDAEKKAIEKNKSICLPQTIEHQLMRHHHIKGTHST